MVEDGGWGEGGGSVGEMWTSTLNSFIQRRKVRIFALATSYLAFDGSK